MCTLESISEAAAEPFLLTPVPMWVALVAALAAIASAASAFIATRNKGITDAPDIELTIDPIQVIHGEIKIRLTNRGKVDARDVRVDWDYDPLGRQHNKQSWQLPLLRKGEYAIASLEMQGQQEPTSIVHQYEDLSDPSNASSRGTISYVSQLAFFNRRTRKPIQMPAAGDLHARINEAVNAEVRKHSDMQGQ